MRRAKRADMLAAGHDPYPVAVPRTHTLREVRDAHPDLPPDTATGDRVGVTGRVIFQRNTGKLCFATLREGDGTELQAMLSLAGVGAEELARWKAEVDLGDHVFVEGEVITSKRGELSVHGRPLGDGQQGDAAAPGGAPRAERGDARPSALRRPDRPAAGARHGAYPRPGRPDPASILHDRDFVEVETPMLQLQHGGATARPFMTHANALDTDLYLRIAPELFLKRTVVGGIERVFEINRNFRNEGIDSTHSPEFAMLEAYQAYGTYDDIAELTHDLVIEKCTGRVRFRCRASRRRVGTRLGGQWRQVTLHAAVSEAVDREVTVDTSVEDLRKLAAEFDVEIEESWSAGQIVLELFEKLVEHTLIAPTFVRDYPVETRPLTRAHRSDPRPGRVVGPRRLRHRTGHRLFRARRPRRAARPFACAVAAGRGR